MALYLFGIFLAFLGYLRVSLGIFGYLSVSFWYLFGLFRVSKGIFGYLSVSLNDFEIFLNHLLYL